MPSYQARISWRTGNRCANAWQKLTGLPLVLAMPLNGDEFSQAMVSNGEAWLVLSLAAVLPMMWAFPSEDSMPC